VPIEQTLASVIEGVEKLSGSFSAGRLLQDGVQVAIAGRPNVGKSSLFNSLVQHERAIVTEIPVRRATLYRKRSTLVGYP
jgi:tRNA modification GTPase